MFSAKPGQTVAVASIGSGSVSIGVGVRGTLPTLLVSERRELPLEARAPEQAIASLKQQFTEAGQKVLAQFSANPKAGGINELYCVIRAPWTQIAISSVEKKFEKEEHITESIISDLANQALAAVGDRSRFLDASVAQITLNRYPVKHPEGKRAHHLRITALISSCDPAMRAAVLDVFAALLPAHQVTLYSGVRASLQAATAARPTAEDYVILDVSEEGTAVVVVRNGAPESESYIPEGTRSILTRATQSGTSEQTRQSLRMMARDECSKDTCIIIQAGFAKMEPDLAHTFGESFARLSILRRLPTTLFLIAHPDVADWLSQFFSRIDFTQFTLTAQPFEVIAISPSVPASSPGAPAPDTDVDLTLAFALINKEEHAG